MRKVRTTRELCEGRREVREVPERYVEAAGATVPLAATTDIPPCEAGMMIRCCVDFGEACVKA